MSTETAETPAQRVERLKKELRVAENIVTGTEATLAEVKRRRDEAATRLAEAEKAAAKRTRGQVVAEETITSFRDAVVIYGWDFRHVHGYSLDDLIRALRERQAKRIDAERADAARAQREACVRALEEAKVVPVSTYALNLIRNATIDG